MLREINGIAVGIMHSVFGLAVRRPLVDVGGGFEFFADVAKSDDILHFEAEVVQAGLQVRPVDLSLRTDRDDREIDMTVGKISGGADSLNDLKSECRGIKPNQSLHVLGENRDMPNARHGCASFAISSRLAHTTKYLTRLTRGLLHGTDCGAP